MKILKVDYTVLNDFTDRAYLDMHSRKVSVNYHTGSTWWRGACNTYILNYEVTCSAGDQNDNKRFISYIRQMRLQCTIDDIELDVHEIIQMKQEMHDALDVYLVEKSSMFFDLLEFDKMVLADRGTDQEIISLKLAASQLAYEDTTDKWKKIQELHLSSSPKINILVTRDDDRPNDDLKA
jgi:hypothetical protein